MTTESLAEQMSELSSAEDFLDFFNIEYDQTVVHINRLHILQRFHDYLEKGEASLPPEDDELARRKVYVSLLTRAYQDFVNSDAATEKVFKVFKTSEPQSSFVPLDQLLES